MAVDSRDKRMSMVTLGSPVPMLLPNPDGTIGDSDRAMFMYLYHGIALTAAVQVYGGQARGIQDYYAPTIDVKITNIPEPIRFKDR